MLSCRLETKGYRMSRVHKYYDMIHDKSVLVLIILRGSMHCGNLALLVPKVTETSRCCIHT